MTPLFVRKQNRPHRQEALIPLDDLYSTIENQDQEIESLRFQLKSLKELYVESMQRERLERVASVEELKTLRQQLAHLKDKYRQLHKTSEKGKMLLQERTLFTDGHFEADV